MIINLLKLKIKIYNNKIDTNFHNNKIPKDNECCACLSVISLNSITNVDEKYYRQILLEVCIYVVKTKKIMNEINRELNLGDSGNGEFDEYDNSDE